MMTAKKRLIQADDFYALSRVEDPQVSPDGRWVAFVRVTQDRHHNKALRAVWLVHPDGSGLRQFSAGTGADHSPRWSPDGRRLAFVSDRDGKPQIYLIPVDGGEALPLTVMPNGATVPAWSPDGQSIAFLSSVSVDEMQAEAQSVTQPPCSIAEAAEMTGQDDDLFDPRVVARLPFRSGTKFWDERFAHIYVVPVAGTERRPRRLTDGAQDYAAPYWSADGRSLFSVTSRRPEHDAAWLFNAVVQIALDDGTVMPLTDPAWSCSDVRPSPDGQWLAFLTRPAELPTRQQAHVAVLPVTGGAMQRLTLSFDRTIELLEWTANSDALIYTARNSGAVPVFRVVTQGGEPELAAHPNGTTVGLSTGPDGLITTTTFTADGRCEVYTAAGGVEQRLTDFNGPFLQRVQVSPFEAFRYSVDGREIDGWLLKPPGYVEGTRYPLALNIHGGPAATWGPSTPSMWLEWQLHAASGYVVFFCNPRGSTGYGDAFTQANHRDWGDGPTRDVLAGVDLLLEQGLADPDRLAITGGSYGGYLTAWIVGHDDRFAAAVAQRGVYHLHSFHGTTDIPLFMASYMQAEPWEDPRGFWEQSPLAYAHQIKTPLLLIHSEQDYRVPIAEAEQLFASVKRAGGTVELVRYPGEGHELSRSGQPKHVVDRLARIVAWWDRYCKPENAT